MDMAAQGVPHKQISAELKRSLWAVRSRLYYIRGKNGVASTHHKWRVSELDELRALYLRGLTGREIAEALGVSANAVHNKVAELRKRGDLYSRRK